MRDTVYCVLCVLLTLAIGVLSARYVLGDLWILAFFESLQLHFAIACMIGALVTLVVRRYWYALLLFIAATALAIHAVVLLWQYAAPPAAENGKPVYHLLSFNIDNGNFANGGKIADLIVGSKADVVEIFEAGPLLPQMSRLHDAYPYQIGCGVLTTECDSLLLSKRPFVQQSLRDLGALWRQRLLLGIVDFDGHPVNFVTAHLSKPYFDEFHQDELVKLYYFLYWIKGPLILAGDFNASIIAPDMHKFLRRSGLNHVFPEPSTWPIKAGAYGISIDHVFARPPIHLQSVRQIPDAMGSNHYGLMTEFTVE